MDYLFYYRFGEIHRYTDNWKNRIENFPIVHFLLIHVSLKYKRHNVEALHYEISNITYSIILNFNFLSPLSGSSLHTVSLEVNQIKTITWTDR